MPVDILALRHIGNAVLPHRLRHRQAIDADAAGLRADDAHDGVEQGRFAGAVHPDEGTHGAAREGEGDVFDGAVPVRVGNADVFYRKRGRIRVGSH